MTYSFISFKVYPPYTFLFDPDRHINGGTILITAIVVGTILVILIIAVLIWLLRSPNRADSPSLHLPPIYFNPFRHLYSNFLSRLYYESQGFSDLFWPLDLPNKIGIFFAAVIFLGVWGAAVGAIWAAALYKDFTSGALWGSVGGAIFALVLSPFYTRNLFAKKRFWFIMSGCIFISGMVGLIVCLVRWLT